MTVSTRRAGNPKPHRHLRLAPAPTAEPCWDPDRYRAGVFLDTAAGLIREFGLRRVCPAAADDLGRDFCGRCVACHIRSARTAYAAAQPNAPTMSLRTAQTIAVAVAIEFDLDTTIPADLTTAVEALRNAAHDLYRQSLPASVTTARIPR